MSYTVLARQYRPKNFSEMVGQDHVVRALSNALKNQRLHHAYLFTGTRGVGKTTVSRILAKSLNCVGADGNGGITNEPCGVCQACKDIDAGRFVDYVELDAASNRGVDEISQLLEQAIYKPVVGRFKVFMIDEVHMLSSTAFNAMLKTLEEPPEYLKFVLATTDPQKVPVTVLSRCLQFNLRSMAPETISEHLEQVLRQESVAFDSTSLRMLARAAHGSMRDALSLTDQAIAYGSGAIEEVAVRQMLGSVDRSHIYELIQAIAQGHGSTVVALVDQMRMQSLSPKAAFDEMATVLQRMAILRVAPKAAHADDPDDAHIAALIPLMQPDEVQLLYSIILHGQEELGLASDEYAAMVMVLLRMLAFIPAVDPVGQVAQVKPLNDKVMPISANHLTEKKTEFLASTNTQPETGNVPSMGDGATVAVMTAPSSPIQAKEINPTQTEHVNNHAIASISSGSGFADQQTQLPSVIEQYDVDDVPPWVSESIPDELMVTSNKMVDVSASSEEGFIDGIAQVKIGELPHAQSVGSSNITLNTANLSSEDKVTPISVSGDMKEEDNSHPTLLSKQTQELPEATVQSQRWGGVAQELIDKKLVTALARELVLNAQISDISNDEKHWRFKCPMKTLIGEANQKKVSEALQTLLGHPVFASFEYADVNDTLALRLQALNQQYIEQAHAAVAADPDIQKWLMQYKGALIVSGTIQPVLNDLKEQE